MQSKSTMHPSSATADRTQRYLPSIGAHLHYSQIDCSRVILMAINAYQFR